MMGNHLVYVEDILFSLHLPPPVFIRLLSHGWAKGELEIWWVPFHATIVRLLTLDVHVCVWTVEGVQLSCTHTYTHACHPACSCVLCSAPAAATNQQPQLFFFSPKKRENPSLSLIPPPKTKKHISSFILHFVLAYEKREEKETWHMLAICKTFLPSNFSSSLLLLLLPITRWRLEKDRHHLAPLAPPLIFVYDWAIIRPRTDHTFLHIFLPSCILKKIRREQK